MGLKKLDRKYLSPKHLWRSERISSEADLMERYGLKNHREIWRIHFKLSKWRKLARCLITSKDQKTTEEFLNSLINIGCIKEKKLESVFEITPEDMLERRLQTIVFRKGLARTMKQARNFIAHKHVFINNKVVNIPGYIVPLDEEDKITCDLVVNTENIGTSARKSTAKRKKRKSAKKLKDKSAKSK